MEIGYVTSNRGKFEEARHILEEWTLKRIDIDLPELQGDRREIIYEKAKEASRRVKEPLIVEDVSLECYALNGLPGPYVKDFLRKLGEEGLYELVYKYSDHRADVICTAAYIEPGSDPVLFEGLMQGTIVPPKGDVRHSTLSWNTIFVPEGGTKTFGEISLKEHGKISMRSIALKKLRHYLEGRDKI